MNTIWFWLIHPESYSRAYAWRMLCINESYALYVYNVCIYILCNQTPRLRNKMYRLPNRLTPYSIMGATITSPLSPSYCCDMREVSGWWGFFKWARWWREALPPRAAVRRWLRKFVADPTLNAGEWCDIYMHIYMFICINIYMI